jgi:hypothetical protein
MGTQCAPSLRVTPLNAEDRDIHGFTRNLFYKAALLFGAENLKPS